MVRSLITHSLALGSFLSGNSRLATAFPQSTENNAALQGCLTNAVGGDAARAQFPSEGNFRTQDVKPYIRQYPYTRTAVMYPNTVDEVAEIVKCASQNNLKVQVRSGGHDYVNKCISGSDGAITVDLNNLNQLSVDQATVIVTIGPSNGLKAVNEGLRNNGRRMIPHRTSATVGIGGHTLPHSGVWTPSATSKSSSPTAPSRASQHPDLFWATRGAGQSFGIATEFVFQTKPEPSNPIISYRYNITSPDPPVLAEALHSWQAIIADPQLPRDLYTLAFLQGAMLLGIKAVLDPGDVFAAGHGVKPARG
ncbi:hypothetical protein SLS56_005018 [Neofusicoccum ribis]|uniref:FAD-binding PCMH-type domain-containing protein n=1 Tax=Neofusicoccum ribis TaxID=45134 RepID=A0ABR3SUV2_9PEZI